MVTKVTYHYIVWGRGRFGSCTLAEAKALIARFGNGVSVTKHTHTKERLR